MLQKKTKQLEKKHVSTNLKESSYLICTLVIDILRFPIIVAIREPSHEFPAGGCQKKKNYLRIGTLKCEYITMFAHKCWNPRSKLMQNILMHSENTNNHEERKKIKQDGQTS
jgi:hypothetical protein